MPTQRELQIMDKLKSKTTSTSPTMTKKVNVGDKIGATIVDTGKNLTYGISKGVEGIVDFGANLIGVIGGVFGATDFQDSITDFVQTDYSNKYINENIDKAYSNATGNTLQDTTYMNDFFRGVTTSIGQMLPSIALATITGGGSVASLTSFGVGAAGSSTEQALNDGATAGQATLYGILEGGKEVATELVGGKIASKLIGSSGKVMGVIGKGTANSITKTTGKTLVKQWLKDSVEEGFEEVLGDIIDPFIQMTYKDGSYSELFGESGGVKGLLTDFASGSLVGGIMGGASTTYNINSVGYENYKLMQDVNNLRTLKEDAKQAFFRGDNQSVNEKSSAYRSLLAETQADFVRVAERYEQIQSPRKKARYSNNADVIATNLKSINDTGEYGEIKSAITAILGDTVEFSNVDSYSVSTKNITLNEANFSNSNEMKNGMVHEYGHKNYTQALADLVLENVPDNDYQILMKEYSEKYESTIKESQEYKKMLEEGKTAYEAYQSIYQDYVREEIVCDLLGDYFDNIGDFAKAVSKSSSKGIKRLTSAIKGLFKGKNKPNNYNEVLELLKDRQTEAELSENALQNEKVDIKYKQDSTYLENINESLKEFKTKNEISEFSKEEIELVEKKTNQNFKKYYTKDRNYIYKMFYQDLDVDLLLGCLEFDRIGAINEYGFSHKLYNSGQTKESILKLIEDIKNNGIISEIILQVDPESGRIYVTEGNHRIQVAKMVGIKTLPTRITVEPSFRNPISQVYVENWETKYKSLLEIRDDKYFVADELLEDVNNGDTKLEGINYDRRRSNQNDKKFRSNSNKSSDSLPNVERENKQSVGGIFQDSKGSLEQSKRQTGSRELDDSNSSGLSSGTFKRGSFGSTSKSGRSNRERTKNTGGTGNQTRLRITGNQAVDNLLSSTPQESKIKEIKRGEDTIIAAVNAQAGLETDIASIFESKGLTKVEARYNARALVNRGRSSTNRAINMIENGIFDVESDKKIVKSLKEIYSGLNEEVANTFENYLFHKHNIDRMSLSERTNEQGENLGLKNKPVFGEEITADDSRKIVEDLEREYPEFIRKAEDIYNYFDYLLKESLNHGIINEKGYSAMRSYYPHYVPTFRVSKNTPTQGLSQNMSVRGYVGAKGGSDTLMPIRQSLTTLTMRTTRANALNDIVSALGIESEITQTTEVDTIDLFDSEEDIEIGVESKEVKDKNKTYDITYFVEGEKRKITARYQSAIGINELQSVNGINDNLDNLIKNGLSKLMQGFKGLVTNYNPFFTIRNVVRDFQDGLFNSRYGSKTFTKNYAKAIQLMKNNDYLWKLYQQYGGLSGSQFDMANPIEFKERNKLKKILTTPLNWIESVNKFTEQIPRFAEFISSVEAQQKEGYIVDYNRAVYDAQDVTVNFSMKGASHTVQGLNKYAVPFFNAQIQGSYKILRTFTNGKTVKAFSHLIIKAAILGLIPTILNNLLYHDDEEYGTLSDYYKDNFYLLKVGGDFVRIPKGRLFAFISTLANPSDKGAIEYVSSAWDTLSPVTSLRHILSPVEDLKTNTTWYGSPIVSQTYDNTRPKNQFDNETSWFSKKLGELFNYSPLKIEYLLEQYTGVVGDFILPMTSSKGLTNVGKNLASSTLNQFVIDPVYKNNYSSKFYDEYQEIKYQNNEGSIQAKAQLKYMNKIKSYISDIQKQIEDLEVSGLSRKEIENQREILQTTVNMLFKQGLETSKVIRTKLDEKNMSEETYEEDYYNSLYEVLGAESTLKLMDNELYSKAVDLSMLGIDFDTYYSYYMKTKGFGKEYKTEYINRMALTKNQKYLIYIMSGYSVPENVKNGLISLIKNSTISTDYKETLINRLK